MIPGSALFRFAVGLTLPANKVIDNRHEPADQSLTGRLLLQDLRQAFRYPRLRAEGVDALAQLGAKLETMN